MNASTTYWLCRAQGSLTEGPFTLTQLRAMYAAGTITVEALVCEHGAQAWSEARWMLDAEQVPEQETAYIRSRRVRKGGSGCGALVLFLIGLVILFSPLFLLGIAFMILGMMLDVKHGHEWFCGACGNTVAVTSTQCPTCRVILLDIPKMPWSIRLKILGKSLLWALLILAIVTAVVYLYKSL